MSAQPSSSGPLALSSPFLVSEESFSPPPLKIKQGPFPSALHALDASPFLSVPDTMSVPDDITPDASRQIIRRLEQHIDEIVTSYNGITFELEATRNALDIERADRDAAIQSGSSLPTSATASNLTYERQLRDDLLDSMKQIRSQNAMLADDIAIQTSKCAALEKALATEKEGHQRLAVQLKQTSNHKRNSDGPLYALTVQNTLHLRDAVAITLQRHSVLEAQHLASLNQLSGARAALTEAEGQISSLQNNMTVCVDASSTALAVERNLRNEMEARVRKLTKDNDDLRVRERLMMEEIHELRSSAVFRPTGQSTPSDSDSPLDGRLRKLVLRRLSTPARPNCVDAFPDSPLFQHRNDSTPSSCNTSIATSVATPSPIAHRHSVQIYRDSPFAAEAIFKPNSVLKDIINVEHQKRRRASGKENRVPIA